MITSASRHGPFPGRLEPQRISAYAAATGDETAAVLAGMAVPAIFPVILVFDAQEAANGDLPPRLGGRRTAACTGNTMLYYIVR